MTVVPSNAVELMEKHVEGEWGEFQFRRATPTEEDLNITFNLMTTCYFPDEAMSNLNGWPEEFQQEAKRLYAAFLKDHLTFFVLHKETGKPIALRLSCEHRPNIDFTPFDITSQSIAFTAVMKALDDQSNLFEKYQVDRYAFFYHTCVHRDFRQRGLLGEMYRRALALAKARGYKLAKVCFSSPYSRKAGENNGFKESGRVQLRGLLNEDGSIAFPTATNEFVSQSIYVFE